MRLPRQRARGAHVRRAAFLLACCLAMAAAHAPPALAQSPAPSAAAAPAPSEPGQWIALPKLAEGEIRELIADVMLHLEVTQGYRRMAPATVAAMGAPPMVVMAGGVARADGRETVRLGFHIAPRRLPQLWLAGSGPGLEAVPQALKVILAERTKLHARLSLSDLETRVINLSYADADTALFALRAMGYSAITTDEPLRRSDAYRGEDVDLVSDIKLPELPAAPAADPNQAQQSGTPPPVNRLQALRHLPSAISLDRLPLIVRVPAPEPRNVGLVGATDAATTAAQAQRDQLGLTVIPQAASPLSDTVAGGTTQLLVLYHPGYPEQFYKLRRLIHETIDRPARQVFVEGLVLEISDEGLRELGVKWDMKRGAYTFSLGAIGDVPLGGTALSIIRDTTLNITPTQIMARINALVQRNQAEILSRPSVLTLDNRQATIRVGTDIPVATSKDAGGSGSGSTRVAFSFQYIPTGILLNVRPRINEDATEISMVIDATVSATVPGADLRVLDPGTNIALASAPTISTRRVQTYARIRDNTPLIIGGLVSRSQIRGDDKVPYLGEVPVVGKLFGSESTNDGRREVIIVLTPSIVTENIRETKAQYPRDDDRFDLLGTSLFKEHYRIRAEDLVDSSYIRFNRRFLALREAANRLISARPELEARSPFSQWEGTRVPGEFIFVTGMMYRMLDRLDAGEPIRPENLKFFEFTPTGEERPVTVTQVLARYGDGKDYKSFFERQKGKALALTFRPGRGSLDKVDLFSEPRPEITLIDVPDREAWRSKLWELNQPRDGVQRWTILIHEPQDIRRLQLAFATQNTMLNNGGAGGMIFDRFLPGRMLHLQEVSPTWERIVLAPLAQYFFLGEHWYMYFQQQHEAAMNTLERELRKPEYAEMLGSGAVPR